MSRIDWLEESGTDVPRDDEWLSAWEAVHLASLRFAKRRNDWRLGRWTAKLAVASYLGRAPTVAFLSRTEFCAAPSGAPRVHFPEEASISISHRAGRAICCVAGSGVALGCDLEIVEPRSSAFM